MKTLYRLDFSTGKSYVGITSREPYRRFLEHCSKASLGSTLQEAFRLDPNPSITTLAVVEDHMWHETERRAITYFGTLRPNGYNTTVGGRGGVFGELNPRFGVPCSEEVKEKLRSHRGEGSKMYGRFHSEETKAKISASNKGKPRTESQILAVIASNKRRASKKGGT